MTRLNDLQTSPLIFVFVPVINIDSLPKMSVIIFPIIGTEETILGDEVNQMVTIKRL